MYTAVSRDYNLTASQKLQFLHNLFRGDALSFYTRDVQPRALTFGDAIGMLQGHFNSVDRQKRVKAELLSLSLVQYTEDADGSARKGLEKLAAHITNRAAMCPMNFRHESHQVEFLRQAVIDHEWATPVLLRVNGQTRYQEFYTDLAKALQIHEEKQSRGNKSGSVSKPGTPSSSSKPTILFNQPRYGAKKIAKAIFPGNELDKSCWNCGKLGHRFPKCHAPLDAARIAARKAQYFEKKSSGGTYNSAKQVLHEVVLGLNDLLELDSDDNIAEDPVETFFGAMDDDADSYSSSENESQPLKDSSTTHFNASVQVQETYHSDSDF